MTFSVTDLPALEKALTTSTYLSGADKPSQVDADIINQLRGREIIFKQLSNVFLLTICFCILQRKRSFLALTLTLTFTAGTVSLAFSLLKLKSSGLLLQQLHQLPQLPSLPLRP